MPFFLLGDITILVWLCWCATNTARFLGNLLEVNMPTLVLNFAVNRKLPDVVRDTFGDEILRMNVKQMRDEGYTVAFPFVDRQLTAKKSDKADILRKSLELPLLHDIELWSGSILFPNVRLPNELWTIQGKSYGFGQIQLFFDLRQKKQELEILFHTVTAEEVDLDGWKKIFGGAIQRAERVIRLTNTTRRLLQSVRGKDKGYETRAITEHFESVAGILF